MVTRFFDAKKNDIHLLLKATAAIPSLYSGRVMIDGKRYVDGGLLEPVPISKAVQMGCKELYVILNRAAGDKQPSYVRQLIGKMPGRISRLMAEHNRIKAEVDQFLRRPYGNISVTIIRPYEPMPVSRFTSSREKLQFCIDTGYHDGLEFIRSRQITQ
jgi:predicted patatin/cPLA2 family phospholipase